MSESMKINYLKVCRFTLQFTLTLSLIAGAVRFIVFRDILTALFYGGMVITCTWILNLIENEEKI